jgi:hypothetical protein
MPLHRSLHHFVPAQSLFHEAKNQQVTAIHEILPPVDSARTPYLFGNRMTHDLTARFHSLRAVRYNAGSTRATRDQSS